MGLGHALRAATATAAFAFAFTFASSVSAQVTGPTGGGQPVDNVKPGLGIDYFVRKSGGSPTDIGRIRMSAGGFLDAGETPAGYDFARGQVLSIAGNQTLFDRLGTVYGGNGQTTFALPNLSGRAPMGAGTGPGLSNHFLGDAVGATSVTLTTPQMPAHQHALPAGLGTTGVTGGSQPHTNMGPTVAINFSINVDGVFPPRDLVAGGAAAAVDAVGDADDPIGRVNLHAGTLLPTDTGRALAQGQLVSIAQETALFAVIGTTYGGNGQTTFALPDLRGRLPVHGVLGGNPVLPGGRTGRLAGERYGAEMVTLLTSEMPAHAHTLPPTALTTGATGGGQPHDNLQPSLGLHYIIAMEGIYPSDGGLGEGDPFLGEVALFAGSFAPSGWAFAEGQLLSISQNSALFSLRLNRYGGNGQTTFALPDLRSRTAFGTGVGPEMSLTLGEVFGAELTTLTESQLPSHTHTAAVPEPATVALLILPAAILIRRRRVA
jgi:microcystin-dependent protein